jgi:hypothetical protein
MMNKLSKEKRGHITLVCLGTGILLAAVYFLLINPEYGAIERAKAKTTRANKDLQDKLALIQRQDAIKNELHEMSTTLAEAEHDVAFGDPTAWFYETLRNFKGHYAVEISSYGQPSLGNVDLLPKYPYNQIKITVNGTAFYHDLGKFIADFENTFPHMRIVNLALDPASGGIGPGRSPVAGEMLSFRMDIITLVKTAETQN